MQKDLEANTILSHYRIVSKIGAGGMGEVYRAEDTRLGRKVALKILPAEVASNRERMERFIREAKSAAALNHPNIATIYEIGEHDGTNFIAMEFVDGVTLREKIHRDKVPLSKLLKYLIQVAEGLSKAHAAGIVHRDLKPDNIMITRDDYAKVLDFGLAKLVEPQRTFESGQVGSSEIATAIMQQQSIPGTVVGTVGYMSPEQASGRVNEIDHRSDIFSFGCILFEAATGQRAFEGKDALDSLHKIVHAPTPQLKDVNPLAPDDLQRVVRRCLAKEPEKRYQSMKEVALEIDDLQQELKGLTGSEYSGRPTSPTTVTTSGTTRADEGFWVAVLPFKARDADPDVAALAEGLPEEIVTGLSRFRYLSVVASASVARLKGETEDEQALGTKLGARYGLQGSFRKEASGIRVSAQLVDTQTGAQLWAETYNRDLQTSSIFAAQDDVAARIVATVADSYGVLVHSMRAAIRQKDDADLTPVEWQFQYFAYREQITPSAHAALKSRLERAAKRDDRQSDLWACLAQIYVDEYAFGFQDDATSLDRALAAGRRGVELDRANQFALVALAQVHFFRQDLSAFGPAAERAMALNPLNTDALGILGLQIVHTGEFERGTAIVRRAMALNPNHAGWMHFAPLWEHFHKGEYEQALECANRVDVPGLFWPYLVMASACGHLGRRAEAEAAVRDLLALDPEFAAHVRANVGTWHFASGLMNSILEGLRKAGLEIDKVSETPDKEGVDASTAFPSFEGRPAIAVLPFDNRSNDPEQEYFADGLAEDLITRLSLWRSFPVIARNSSFVYKGKAVDVKKVSADLGVRYVVEGSVRKAGNQVRIAAQLIDASTGQHVWAKTYDRELTDVFAVQDEISGAIAASLVGDLQRAEHQRAQRRAPENLEAWGLYQRALPLLYRFTREDSNQARALLERATALDPQFSTALARLAELGVWDFIFAWTDSPQQTLDGAVAQARRAVNLDPTDAEAHSELAFALMTAGFGDEALEAALHGLDLNPCLPFALIVEGYLRNLSGNPPEESIELMKRAMRLSPHDPAEFLFYDVLSAAYMNAGRYAEGLAAGRRLVALLPSYYWGYLWSAMNAVGLGRHEEARAMIRDARQVHPGLSLALARQALGAMAPQVERRFTEALRQAGLEIGDEEPSTSSAPSLALSEKRADEGFWVAVLPFKHSGASADLTALADALSDDIVTGLSRFSYLRVIARSSTSRYLHEAVDVRAAGRGLGARYVLEGNLRQSGGKLRLAVQLVDAVSGAHLWAESYERTFSSETVFDLQDDLVPRIVSTVADTYGVLPRSMSEMLRKKSPDQLSPYEAVLRSFGYYERITPEEHAKVTEVLERAVDNAPEQADCWAMLAMMYKDEHTHGFNVRPDPLGRALAAAHRAVEAAPSNHLAYHALASALFFRREIAAFRNAAERTIALNPMDGGTTAFVGHLMAYAGDWERGCALVEHARQLNPNHPGWYWFPAFFDAYRKRDYRGALEVALKINMPGYFYSSAVIAAAYAQLGEREATRQAVLQLLAMKPGFAAAAREELEKWFGPGALLEHFLDGLRKAGLEIATEKGSAAAAPDLARSSAVGSGAARAEEGFWIAVLPFKFTGASPELRALAEGLSEDIVTGLSRFSYLRVIARSSTSRFTNESRDVRLVAQELGARYVLEGGLRQAGTKLRLAVQLVDASTGVHLWAENYERAFDPESVFELQDDLVPRIVATIADIHGVLPRSMSQLVLSRAPEQLSPYEAVLRSFNYFHVVTPEELAAARSCLEMAVTKAPGYVDAWAMLAVLCDQDYGQGFNLTSDSLANGLSAARRAVEVGPSNHLAYFSLAQALFFQKEFQSFRDAAERAVSLNPMDGNSLAFMGELLTYVGDSERGLALAGRAKQLNPHHPGWYWYADFFNAYRLRDYRGALSFVRKANLPNHWGMHCGIAASAGQLGESEVAAKAVRDLLKLRPEFVDRFRKNCEKWWEPELVEHLIEGLRKAGLEIADEDEGSSHSLTETGSEVPLQVTGALQKPSIAVLPFVNISNDPDNDFFCDGLAEELLNALAKIDELKVAARTSAFSFKGKNTNVNEIGTALSVKTVLEGSVRKSGNRLRITVQLVNAADGYHLWSERYDREMKDIFDVQDEITLAVVEALKVKLFGEEQAAILKRHTRNAEAHEFYLRGLSYFGRFTPEGFQKAIEGFKRAIAIDAGYASAYAGLADAYTEMSFFSFAPSEWMPKAREAAMRALELDDALGDAHNSLAIIKMYYDWDYTGAEREYRRALDLDRGSARIHMWYGWYLGLMGRFDESFKELQRAQELDPLSDPINLGIGVIFHWSRQPERAIEQFRKMLELNPNYPLAYNFLAEAYEQKGDFVSAIATIERLQQAANDPLTLSTVGYVYAKSGDHAKAMEILNELEKRSNQEYVTALHFAQIYAGLGDNEQALAWLDKACNERSVWMTFVRVDPKFDPLHDDPRFKDLLKRMNLSE